MTGRLTDKLAAVTGAASGFGAEIARRFLDEGATVLLIDRDERVVETVEDLVAVGLPASAAVADVTDEAALAGAVRAVTPDRGLDVMVNNAGVLAGGWIDEPGATDALRRLIEVNLIGVWNGCRVAIESMGSTGGAIINTSSTAATVPTPAGVAYGMIKAAVVHLTRSLAVGHGPEGIRVNAVLPGPSATAIFGDEVTDPEELERRFLDYIPLGRLASPGDVAAAMVFLASDESAFVSGVALAVDGAMQPRLPRRLGPPTGTTT